MGKYQRSTACWHNCLVSTSTLVRKCQWLWQEVLTLCCVQACALSEHEMLCGQKGGGLQWLQLLKCCPTLPHCS